MYVHVFPEAHCVHVLPEDETSRDCELLLKQDHPSDALDAMWAHDAARVCWANRSTLRRFDAHAMGVIMFDQRALLGMCVW